MKKAGIILVIAVGLAVLAFANFYFKGGNQQIVIQKTAQTLKIGSVTLNIEVANTDATREQGLSGKEGLKSDEGMLFVFDTDNYYGFWMKDMNFAIDIAWINKDKKIIHIESNVSPDTYPKIFSPKSPSLYVLETPAGFFESNKIKIGDVLEF